MSADVFEIIELENGDLALRKQDQKQGTFLIKIEFSEALKTYLEDSTLDIAQAMLKAGIHQFYQNIDEADTEKDSLSNLLH